MRFARIEGAASASHVPMFGGRCSAKGGFVCEDSVRRCCTPKLAIARSCGGRRKLFPSMRQELATGARELNCDFRDLKNVIERTFRARTIFGGKRRLNPNFRRRGRAGQSCRRLLAQLQSTSPGKCGSNRSGEDFGRARENENQAIAVFGSRTAGS